MSDIVIKTYEKGVEEEQAKLGTETTSEWTDFGQTPAENLKQYYARDDFDPETRLYAYKEDKLVGFVVCRILPDAEDGIKRAQHDFPLAINQDEEIGKLLYNKLMETLKAKEVQIVEARACKTWGNTITLAEKLGYKKARTLYVLIGAKVEDIKFNKEAKIEFQDFDPKEDKEAIITLFKEHFNMTEEQATANFEGIVSNADAKYNQPIIKKDGKIVARGLVAIQEDDQPAIFRPLVPDPQKHFDAYMKKAVEIAKKEGAKSFRTFLFGPALEHREFYEKHGIVTDNEVLIYEKEI